jgi:hypothetical protein
LMAPLLGWDDGVKAKQLGAFRDLAANYLPYIDGRGVGAVGRSVEQAVRQN